MRRWPITILTLAAVVVAASGALAYFTTTGAGRAAASIGTIGAPGSVSAQQTAANVSVSWGAATLASGGSVTGYRVSRSDGSGVCGTPTLVTTLSCTDTGVPAGTYTYTVTAVYGSWSASATSAQITILVAPSLTSTPSNPSANTSPSIAFSGASAYACKLDSGAFASCSSPRSYSGLTAGSHTFAVHATSGSSTGPDSTYTWTIDTAAPSISSQPSNPSSGAVSFSFTHAESAYSFLCQLDGGGFSACTSPTAYSALSSGSHTFQVEAKGADGAVTSVASYTWTVDATAPTQALALASGASGAFLGGGATLYYRGSASGAFQFVDTVTDSGSGSASATYPAISATGWTHAGETITTPAGGPYTSSAFSWTASPANPTYSVTAKDAVGNSTSTSVTFVNDTSAPSGGALTVGGATAGGSGALVYSSSASFAIGARTDYAEAQSASQSGLASSVLTVQSETLSGGACGTPGSGGPFVSAQTISGTTQPSGIVTGYCYLYTLTGTDKVGNSALISATVAVDTTAPSTPTLTFSGTTNAFYNAGTLYFRPAPGGAYTVSAASSDAESGVASYTFSSLAANNFTVSQSAGQASYTFGASATQPGSAATVSAANLAGLSSGNASYTLISDTTAPSGGALTVNGTAASAAGTSSATTSTAFTIASRTDYSETQSATQSGLRSSALTVQSETLTGSTCGTPGSGGPFTSAQSVSATTQPSGIQGGYCYLYTLTGTDNVGNAATVKTTVAVDIAIASMSIANHSGGTAGKAEAGDTLTVVFNGPIAVASMCSTWSGNTSNQSLSANNDVTVTIADGGILGGNDALTVASATCTFQLGTIDLGSSAYVSVANATFSGSGTSASTITYTASTFTLVVKLGAKGGLGLVGTVSSSAATLSPNANLTGIDTNHPPSFTTANVPQF